MKKIKKTAAVCLMALCVCLLSACGSTGTKNENDMAGNSAANSTPGIGTGKGDADNGFLNDVTAGTDDKNSGVLGDVLDDAGNTAGNIIDDIGSGIDNVANDITGGGTGRIGR